MKSSLLAPTLGLALLAAASAFADVSAPADAPCRATYAPAPPYPPLESVGGVPHGEAHLMLRIDPQGRLADTLVTAYSHRGFAEAAVLAVRNWKFEPARIAGEPVYGTIEAAFDFNTVGILATTHVGPPDEVRLDAGRLQYRPVVPGDLDRAPQAASRVAPTYPAEWARRGIRGAAVLEFYIDESGRVRMPLVVSADRPELGWIALAALEQWRFEPPTRGGKPALVRAQQDFSFGAPGG